MTDHVTDQSIDTLLTKLGTDDSFRAAFAADPGNALAAVGLSVSILAGGEAANLAAPGSDDQDLASKENFLAVRDELRTSQRGFPFTPIHMDLQPSGTLASKESFLVVRDELRASHSGYPFQPIHMDIQPSGALAPKESFLAVRDQLRASHNGYPFNPINLDLQPAPARAA